MTRDNFNLFFYTRIREEDWRENKEYVCDEYGSLEEFEGNTQEDFEELVFANMAAYDAGTKEYVVFHKENYDWAEHKILKPGEKRTPQQEASQVLGNESDDLYGMLASKLPDDPKKAMNGYWTNAESEIMCKTEEMANATADLLTAAGYDICTCQYNEDIGCCQETDICYGWWSVHINGM